MILDTNILDNRPAVPFSNGKALSMANLHHKNTAWAETVRDITSRLAIYRKLKELGHSDESIFTIYNKSNPVN